MDQAAIQSIVLDGIMIIPIIACYFLLFREDFLLSARATAGCFLLLLILSVPGSLLAGDTVWYKLLYTLVPFVMYPLLLRRNRLNGWITTVLYTNVLNVLTVFLMGMILGVCSLISGSSTWPVLDHFSVYFNLLFLVPFAPSVVMSYLIVRALKADVIEIHGVQKVLLVLLIPVNTCVLNSLKHLITDITVYRSQPDGFAYFLDILNMILFMTGLAMLLYHHLKKTRRAYRQTQEKEAAEETAYQEDVTQLQNELRQARHDAAGWKSRRGEP